MIRVLIVEDHFVVRAGLRAVVNAQADMKVAGEAKSGPEALELHRLHAPDVTLMDLQIPGLDGISAIRAILAATPEARILVLTTFGGEEQIAEALEAGARGYFLKHVDEEELLSAIRAIHAGEERVPVQVASRIAERQSRPELTVREREVLVLLAQGLTDAGIAATLKVSEPTVRVYVSRLVAKLGCEERTQAVAEAFRRGFIRLDPGDSENR